MSSVSNSPKSQEEVENMRRDALEKAVNECTDKIKLEKCVCDLRFVRICTSTWWEDQCLPRFFLVTIIYDKNELVMYVNERVSVAFILHELFRINVLSKKEASYSCLKSIGSDRTLELDDQIDYNLSESRLIVHLRDNSSATSEIFLKGLQGETRVLQVDCDCMVEFFKLYVHVDTGVDFNVQSLFFAGKKLENGHRLSDYNIQNGSTVHLTIRLRGGKPVIRLRSSNGQCIFNVHVRLDLAGDLWYLTNVYPLSSNTDHSSFIEWNHIEVNPDGRLLLNDKKNTIEIDRSYLPSIQDDNEHRMLFWEALTHSYSSVFSLDHGLCVPRKDFSRILNYLLKKMSFSVEDRDDMITYVIPHLNDADPEYHHSYVVFRFLSSDEYSSVAQLNVRPLPERIVRAFLLYRLSSGQEPVSTIDDIDKANDCQQESSFSSSGLIVHEWGSMFIS